MKILMLRMTKNVILVVFSVHCGEKIWIIVNFYWEDSFDIWVLVTSTGKQTLLHSAYILLGEAMMINTFTFAILKNWHYWPPVLADVLLPRGWSPSPLSTGWRISAPPWATLTVVLITLAWCHSLLEFKSSPRWLEMYVPSSTNLVKGFL